jgi:hypothetical protein
MNTLDLIMADVARAKRTDTPIYDGTAKGIAAGWISSSNIGFLRLNSTGTVTPDLFAEIDAEIRVVKSSPQHFDADETVKDLGTAAQNVEMLRCLKTYARKCGERGAQAGWDRVAPDVLTEEMEYNSDAE